MFKKQLVLAAIDRPSDVNRIIDVALRTAKAREADLHVIQVIPREAMRVDDRNGPWRFERDGVRVRSVTLRGTPQHVIPAYAKLHQAAILVVERDYGSSRFWRNSRVVNELARQSPMPLLVLPKRRGSGREESGLRRILTAVDSSIASAVALRTAFDRSRRQPLEMRAQSPFVSWRRISVCGGHFIL